MWQMWNSYQMDKDSEKWEVYAGEYEAGIRLNS